MSRLLALVAVKGLENKEKVLMLTRAGYGQTEIAGLLDFKISAVSMIVLRDKQKASHGKKSKKSSKGSTATVADDGGAE